MLWEKRSGLATKRPPRVDYDHIFPFKFCRTDPRLFGKATDNLTPCNYEGFIQLLRFFAIIQLRYDNYVRETGDDSKSINIVTNVFHSSFCFYYG